MIHCHHCGLASDPGRPLLFPRCLTSVTACRDEFHWWCDDLGVRIRYCDWRFADILGSKTNEPTTGGERDKVAWLHGRPSSQEDDRRQVR